MHRCSQSIITITPPGCKISTSASAICEVNLSCTCGRREYKSTRRANFEIPVIFRFLQEYNQYELRHEKELSDARNEKKPQSL